MVKIYKSLAFSNDKILYVPLKVSPASSTPGHHRSSSRRQGSGVGRGGGLCPIESVSSNVDDRPRPQLLAPVGERGGQRRRGERSQGSRAARRPWTRRPSLWRRWPGAGVKSRPSVVPVVPLKERGGGPPLLDVPPAAAKKRSAARSGPRCSSARERATD
jgi:hypothetical protein